MSIIAATDSKYQAAVESLVLRECDFQAKYIKHIYREIPTIQTRMKKTAHAELAVLGKPCTPKSNTMTVQAYKPSTVDNVLAVVIKDQHGRAYCRWLVGNLAKHAENFKGCFGADLPLTGGTVKVDVCTAIPGGRLFPFTTPQQLGEFLAYGPDAFMSNAFTRCAYADKGPLMAAYIPGAVANNAFNKLYMSDLLQNLLLTSLNRLQHYARHVDNGLFLLPPATQILNSVMGGFLVYRMDERADVVKAYCLIPATEFVTACYMQDFSEQATWYSDFMQCSQKHMKTILPDGAKFMICDAYSRQGVTVTYAMSRILGENDLCSTAELSKQFDYPKQAIEGYIKDQIKGAKRVCFSIDPLQPGMDTQVINSFMPKQSEKPTIDTQKLAEKTVNQSVLKDYTIIIPATKSTPASQLVPKMKATTVNGKKALLLDYTYTDHEKSVKSLTAPLTAKMLVLADQVAQDKNSREVKAVTVSYNGLVIGNKTNQPYNRAEAFILSAIKSILSA